ncbi:MAG: STAS domain-containing protein [Thermoleophilia bacterium]
MEPQPTSSAPASGGVHASTATAPEIRIDRSRPGLAVLELVGEHDLSTAPELRSELRDAALERRAVVVALSPTTFLDSSILGAIVGALRRSRETGLGFAFLLPEGSTPSVHKTLELTGLLSVFPVFGDADDAARAALSGVNAPSGWADPDGA